jgi:hypothetical protein
MFRTLSFFHIRISHFILFHFIFFFFGVKVYVVHESVMEWEVESTILMDLCQHIIKINCLA